MAASNEYKITILGGSKTENAKACEMCAGYFSREQLAKAGPVVKEQNGAAHRTIELKVYLEESDIKEKVEKAFVKEGQYCSVDAE